MSSGKQLGFTNLSIVEAEKTPVGSVQSRRQHLIAKRCCDLILSLAALITLLPLLLVVAVCVRIDSPGPVLFRQVRWGMNGRKISVYKFRSMYAEQGDASGVTQTIANDPRVTRVGRFIRRTNIDELPQLLNVLLGDMVLVGPRCHAVGMFAAGVPYEKLVLNYHERHAMRPGLTGLAQMRGLRGPTDRASKARARIACDLYYVQNFSIWLDFYIIFATLRSEISGGKGF